MKTRIATKSIARIYARATAPARLVRIPTSDGVDRTGLFADWGRNASLPADRARTAYTGSALIRRGRTAATILAFGTLILALALRASAESNADAGALLSKAASTLQAASSVRADFEEIDAYPTPYKDLAQRGTLVLDRTGRLRVDIKRYRRVAASDPWAPSGNDAVSASDGKTYTYAFLHPHSTQVRQEASSTKVLADALKAARPLAGFFGDSGIDATQATFLPDDTWEGATYKVVDFPVTAGDNTVDAHAYIGADNLVHRLIYRRETARGVVVREWNLRNLRLNTPVADVDFAYTPPADATPLKTDRSGDLLAAGTVAPDFTVTDAHGNPVKLSDFRGKTVVLDFWATWCWPCNQSLPHTDAVVRADKERGVVALAVAIWDSKPGFDAWIGKHSYPDIDFAVDPSPQGKDVASALYHIQATPTAYVIDPSGKIVTAIAGYTGPSDDLQAAIDAAQPKAAQASTRF